MLLVLSSVTVLAGVVAFKSLLGTKTDTHKAKVKGGAYGADVQEAYIDATKRHGPYHAQAGQTTEAYVKWREEEFKKSETWVKNKMAFMKSQGVLYMQEVSVYLKGTREVVFRCVVGGVGVGNQEPTGGCALPHLLPSHPLNPQLRWQDDPQRVRRVQSC